MLLFQLLYFAAARKNGDVIEYLMAWKDGYEESIVPSNEAKEKWPLILMEFLENCIEIFTDRTPNIIPFPLTETKNTIGNPLKAECKSWIYKFSVISNIHYIFISFYLLHLLLF